VAKVLVRCALCGDMTLKPAQVVLVLRRGARDDASFRFECPACGSTWNFRADEDIVSALRRAQVPEEILHVPAEVLEPRAGPALTMDDLLDLMLALRQLGVEERAASAPAVLSAASATAARVPRQRRAPALERAPRWVRLLVRLLG
jgi:hypothetical protein